MKTIVLIPRRPVRSAIIALHAVFGILYSSAPASTVPVVRTEVWPGYERHQPQQVCAAASHAYLTSLEGIQIMDCSDASHPASRSFLPLFESWAYPTDIHYLASSNRIVIGTGISYGTHTNTVRGIDVSDPQDPQWIWSGPLFRRPNQVYQTESKVYSSHNLSGLTISTWGAAGSGSRPASVTNAAGRVHVSGARLYVPTTTGFQIFNPSDATYLGTYHAGAPGKALAVDQLMVCLAAADGLHLVDVTSAAAPSQVGYLPLPAGSYSPTEIGLNDDHACLIFSETNLFMMVGIDTPESPVVSGTYGFDGPVRHLSVDEGRAYVLAADQLYGSSDLHILDLSDPAAISSLGRLYIHGNARHLAEGNKMLFLADLGFCILGTDSPALSVIAYLPGDFSTLAADGDRVYAGSMSGLTVYDITTPESPLTVTNLYEPAAYLAVGDSSLYRIGGWGMPEFVISDKTDNLNELHRLWWIEGINQVRAFDTAGDLYALLVDDFSGSMVVLDVQNPSLPVLTNYYASAPIMDVAGAVDAGGTNAFLATTNGIEILDLGGGPPFPATVTWDCPPGSAPSRLCRDGDRIALAGTDHLWILDATLFGTGDPVIGETAIEHAVSHMLLSKDQLYVAAGAEGVMIYKVGGDQPGPVLNLARIASNRIELEWETAGPGWQVQHKEALSSTNGWNTLPGTESVTATNLETALPRQFFRLVQ